MSNTTIGKPKKTEDLLRAAADFFEIRDAEYGQSHLRHGKIMAAFFPHGLTLATADDFYMFHLFDLQVIKLNRIAEGKIKGEEHYDSHLDLAVYGAMGAAMVNKLGGSK